MSLAEAGGSQPRYDLPLTTKPATPAQKRRAALTLTRSAIARDATADLALVLNMIGVIGHEPRTTTNAYGVRGHRLKGTS